MVSAFEPGLIRIVLADDHRLLLDSLALYLRNQAGLEVLAFASTGEDVLAVARAHPADVLVMDLAMPGLDPYRRLQQLARIYPKPPSVLILSSSLMGHSLADLFAAGARGYLPKDAEGQQLVAAIKAVASGQLVFPNDAMPSLLRAPATASSSNLSLREQQLLNLMAQGHSNSEIAQMLLLSLGTVKSYTSRLFDKLGVRDRTQAVLLAMRSGRCSAQVTQAMRCNDAA